MKINQLDEISLQSILMQQKVKKLVLRNEETGQVDQYALSINPIGEGKYAKVYKAQNMRNPNKIFAAKVIKIESEEVKKEFLKELKIIQNLPSCPNLVKTHKEHFQSPTHLYIFQEFCESGTLMSFRSQKFGAALSEDQIYDLFYQVTNGLITLLEAGIVHEDIKPLNILKRGRVFKLCDFGVSEMSCECKETTTRKGTISYMPPQKLKSRKFLPNEKSDIYSLGTCLYEVIFGFHPYLKKKTANYKEYLAALEESTPRPIPILMKKIGSSSLRLENFLKFLQRMIDLNQKTRVSLAELKEFIKTTQPFKFMTPPEQQPFDQPNEDQRDSYAQNFKNLYESVVDYTPKHKDELSLTSKRKKQAPKQQVKQAVAMNQQKILLESIINQYNEQNPFFVDVIGLLIRGIDYIRKSNFNELNLKGVDKNIAGLELEDCKISRYLKYLIFQFALAVRKKQIERYQAYLDEDQLENLLKDISYLNNEFNKFLIESSFANKEKFSEYLEDIDRLTLWNQISSHLNEFLSSVSIVKENKKDELLSIFFCCQMPKILQLLSNLRSIFSPHSLKEQFTFSYLGDTSLENGRKLLQHVFEIQSQKTQSIREAVQRQLQKRQIQVFFEIEEDSGEVQVIDQEDFA